MQLYQDDNRDAVWNLGVIFGYDKRNKINKVKFDVNWICHK